MRDLFKQSLEWFDRASRVIPGGIYGHASPAMTVPSFMPYFAKRAKGCRYEDVDGRSYIDYMCGFGPSILGYGHPEVEEAADRQRRDGDCLTHPTPLLVELAEKLVSIVDIADWAVFGKNGSDMTTWAIQVAREFTGRKKVVRIAGSYHGTHAWCTPGHGGLIDEDRAHIHSFPWNDPDAFDSLIKKYPNQIAALIVTPFHHPAYGNMELPAEGFLQILQQFCSREGIIMIVDDIRCGFRIHHGGSHRHFGFEPDLICFCKALGNGHPISAAVGRKELKVAASRVFLTGSYWNSAVPMAAALTCLNILERDNVVEHLRSMGEKLIRGLEASAAAHGLSVYCSGHAALPFMTFANETNFWRSQHFAAACAEYGVFFHPHHNWFLSAAHQTQDIDETLKAADKAFAEIKQRFGN
jgi:glutamate-1-semialdehyde 2,1-aminomutase